MVSSFIWLLRGRDMRRGEVDRVGLDSFQLAVEAQVGL